MTLTWAQIMTRFPNFAGTVIRAHTQRNADREMCFLDFTALTEDDCLVGAVVDSAGDKTDDMVTLLCEYPDGQGCGFKISLRGLRTEGDETVNQRLYAFCRLAKIDHGTVLRALIRRFGGT